MEEGGRGRKMRRVMKGVRDTLREEGREVKQAFPVGGKYIKKNGGSKPVRGELHYCLQM